MTITPEQTVKNTIEALQNLARFMDVLLRSYKNYPADIKQLSESLPNINHAFSMKIGNKPIGKGLKYIHGDLNCRNIMVKRGDKNNEFMLIDFPNVTSDMLRPAATDYVKAETELLFLIMDYHSGLDIDPTRIPEWLDIFSSAESSIDVNITNVKDKHLKTICDCIRAIRAEYKTFVGIENSDWLQYRLVLLEYVLKCISYQDITPVKRAAACIYSKLLIDGLLK